MERVLLLVLIVKSKGGGGGMQQGQDTLSIPVVQPKKGTYPTKTSTLVESATRKAVQQMTLDKISVQYKKVPLLWQPVYSMFSFNVPYLWAISTTSLYWILHLCIVCYGVSCPASFLVYLSVLRGTNRFLDKLRRFTSYSLISTTNRLTVRCHNSDAKNKSPSSDYAWGIVDCQHRRNRYPDSTAHPVALLPLSRSPSVARATGSYTERHTLGWKAWLPKDWTIYLGTQLEMYACHIDI